MKMEKLVAGTNYERTRRIIIHTEDGTITFCSPVNFERVAVVASFFGLTLYTDQDDLMLRHVLGDKKFITIEHPVAGQTYPVPEIEYTHVSGTYVFANNAYVPERFTERAGQQIDVAVIQDRVIIDLYNVTAGTLAFRDEGRLTATADFDAETQGGVTVRLDGEHTEVECDALAELLVPHSDLYGHHNAKGELEHFYSVTFCEGEEKSTYDAVQI